MITFITDDGGGFSSLVEVFDSGSTFSNNSALSGYGGAIHSTSNLWFTGSSFNNNYAGMNGGSINWAPLVLVGAASFDNCTWFNNNALGDGKAIAGRLIINSANLTLADCVFDSHRGMVVMYRYIPLVLLILCL